MPDKSDIAPRWRVLALLAVAAIVFFLPTWWMVAAVGVVEILFWVGLGAGVPALLRQLRKLVPLLAAIFLCYAFLPVEPGNDRWADWQLFGFGISINAFGASLGLLMILRMLAVVLASQLARIGDPRQLARGFRQLGMPKKMALSLDAVLALLVPASPRGGAGGAGGGGHGGGGGQRKGGFGRFWAGLKRLGRGDVGMLVDSFYHHMEEARVHLEGHDEQQDPAFVHDVAVISAITLTMLGIKVLKILPGLPFAPGYKSVLLLPLYIMGGALTRSRFGATICGATMGTVAFLMGDGRYGVFEIAKHVAPGIIVDLLLPFMGPRPSQRSVLVWAGVGLAAAMGRLATLMLVSVAARAPGLLYLIFIPNLLLHSVFGVLSGLVTAPLLRALERRKDKPDELLSTDSKEKGKL